jgi:hypothetical protein
MKLILRMAYNRSDPQRAEEARQLLRTTPVHSFSLIQRIALSNGDTQRAKAAQELLKTMREPSTKQGHPLALIERISASSDDMVRARSEEVFQTCHSSTPKSRGAIRSATSNSELPNGDSMESG